MRTYGSLYSGIGGIDLGLEAAGWTCKWQVEIDPWRSKVLAKHWPDVVRKQDVYECGKHNLSAVDLICGGFPCQSSSISGKRKGTKDKRWLWPPFAEIIDELRPKWVLVENVRGLLSVNDGGAFGEVLRDLAQSGYDAQWDCLPACSFGALHQRYRLFLVAYPKETGLAERVNFFDRDSTPFEGQEETGQPGSTRFLGPQGDWGRDWSCESTLLRKLHGISDRVDQVGALGDAVVPQVANWIGRRIIDIEEA